MDANHVVEAILGDDEDPKDFIARNFTPLPKPDTSHLMVSSTDGGLYDTRKPNWHMEPPLRPNFQRFNTQFNNVNDFKAAWRARGNSNYPLAFQCSDGQFLCEKCVQENLRQIINSTRSGDDDGWRVIGVGQCHGGGGEEPEDYESQCANCNKNLGEIA